MSEVPPKDNIISMAEYRDRRAPNIATNLESCLSDYDIRLRHLQFFVDNMLDWFNNMQGQRMVGEQVQELREKIRQLKQHISGILGLRKKYRRIENTVPKQNDIASHVKESFVTRSASLQLFEETYLQHPLNLDSVENPEIMRQMLQSFKDNTLSLLK